MLDLIQMDVHRPVGSAVADTLFSTQDCKMQPGKHARTGSRKSLPNICTLGACVPGILMPASFGSAVLLSNMQIACNLHDARQPLQLIPSHNFHPTKQGSFCYTEHTSSDLGLTCMKL